MDPLQEELSALLSFRKVIASHLSSILQLPSDLFLPLVQQNTGHRKASHSVFSVVIKRLGSVAGHDTTERGKEGDGHGQGGQRRTVDLDEGTLQRCLVLSLETQEYITNVRMTKDMILFDPVPLRLIQLTMKSIVARSASHDPTQTLAKSGEEKEDAPATDKLGTGKRSLKRDRDSDQLVIVNGSSIQADENAYCSLRRTVLAGFIARTSSASCQSPVKVIMDISSSDVSSSSVKGLYHGLDLTSDSEVLQGSDHDRYLTALKRTLQTGKELQVQIVDGACVVDMTSRQLGKAKVFSSASADGSTLEDPTLVVQTVMSLASHFATYDCERYIWLVPDSKRQFAEQVLYLARVVFKDQDANIQEGQGEEANRKRTPHSKPWTEAIQVVYFGTATGVDVWKSESDLSKGLAGVVEYTHLRMKEIVTKNRGNPGRGTEYGDINDLDDDEEEGSALDEQELARMATLLSTSALVVASIGCKRIRKLNVDMARILDGKGNSGVFLQYVHSRLCG